MMHRIRFAVVAGSAAFASMALAQSGGQIVVTVNGNPVQFVGQGPMMNGDRVFVPLRGVFQSMGANVDWDPSTQTVRADRGPTHVRLTIGQLTAAVNGQPTQLDVAASIVNGSTMVPLRFVGEALGGTVNWLAPTQTVAIQIGDYDIPPHRDHRHDHDHDRPHFVPPPGPAPGAMAPPPAVMFNLPPVIHVGTLLHASFAIDLDAGRAHRGDVIFANVTEPGLPRGTRVRGVVDDAHPRAGGHPGRLSLRWTNLVLPGGKQVPVNGEFTAVGNAKGDWAHGEHFGAGTKFGIRLKQDVHLHK